MVISFLKEFYRAEFARRFILGYSYCLSSGFRHGIIICIGKNKLEGIISLPVTSFQFLSDFEGDFYRFIRSICYCKSILYRSRDHSGCITISLYFLNCVYNFLSDFTVFILGKIGECMLPLIFFAKFDCVCHVTVRHQLHRNAFRHQQRVLFFRAIPFLFDGNINCRRSMRVGNYKTACLIAAVRNCICAGAICSGNCIRCSLFHSIGNLCTVVFILGQIREAVTPLVLAAKYSAVYYLSVNLQINRDAGRLYSIPVIIISPNLSYRNLDLLRRMRICHGKAIFSVSCDRYCIRAGAVSSGDYISCGLFHSIGNCSTVVLILG